MPERIERIRAAFHSALSDHGRIAALDEAAQNFRGVKEKKVMGFLAEIALAEAYSKDVRLVAYLVLYEVSGRGLWNLPPINELNIPGDFDLPFLHECMA